MILLQIYVVKQGDTLYRIARRSGIPMEELIYVNQLQAPGVLCVGQSLLLPQPMTYTVQAGDSLYIIAHRYGLRLQELIAANPQLRDPDVLHPGQILALPQRPTEARTAVVNGYITNTSRQTLEQSLPSLTFLSAFSYHTDIAGKLKKEVTVPLSLSEEEGVRNLMTVTNLRGEGGFSGEIAHAVLTDTEAQDALVSNVLNTVEREGYAGVNLDFEYVFPHDRAAYNQFLARMSDALHRRKMILVTALAPKISDDQKGLLYEAHDYAFHGQAADYCILMTYEWGYTYSPPMAVAPLDRVRKVLDYAVTEIPRGKACWGGSHGEVIGRFYRSLDGGENPVPLESCADAMRVLSAIYEQKEGKL